MNNERYGMTFHTVSGNDYYYDSGTGKVALCEKTEADMIASVLEGKKSLEDICRENPEFEAFIQQEHLFQCPTHTRFSLPSKEEFIKSVKESCGQIILELTEACNLRCGYCIYQEHHPQHRAFGNRNMTFETAKKSMDYILKSHSSPKFALTFYGGEPLINFKVMKESIEYMRSQYPRQPFDISFTTNMTLMTKEIAQYLHELPCEVNILCSMDGPEEMHNLYRKYPDGAGSFQSAIYGLEILRNYFYDPAKDKKIAINCVMAPPYSKRNMERLDTFFRNTLALPEKIECSFEYMDTAKMPLHLENGKAIADDIEGKLEKSPLEEWAADSILENPKYQKRFDLISRDMGRVANRLRSQDGLIQEIPLLGNCIPGQRRIYVTVDGKFKTCEKVGEIPYLGDCERGMDYDKVYQLYYEDYDRNLREICKDCWAQPLCSICYERTMGTNGIRLKKDDAVCASSRRIIKDMFVNYFRYYEEDADGLVNNLKKYTFS